MNYYEVAILKSPLSNLTYQTNELIEIGTKVFVKLARLKNFVKLLFLKK